MKPEELAAKIDAKPFSTEREKLMQQVLFTVLRNSQKRTPVKTGTLRRSETTRMEAGGQRGFVGTNVVYGPFVHEGTRFMAARPFFTEGIRDSLSEVQRMLQRTGDAYLKDLT